MEEAIYYIHVDGSHKGPFTIEQLITERIRPETMVWRAGLSGWIQASNLPEIAAAVERAMESELNGINNESGVPAEHEAYVPHERDYEHVNSFKPRREFHSEAYERPEPNPNHRFANRETCPPQKAAFDFDGLEPNHIPGTLPRTWTNWTVWAIVAIIFGMGVCGIGSIFGIVALVKATNANEAARRGDRFAYDMNGSAKTWTIASFIISVALWALFVIGYIAFMVPLVAISGSMTTY